MKTFEEAITILQKRVKDFPSQLVILGSGWNKVLGGAKIETEIDYMDLFGIKASVPGHQGKLIIAKIRNERIAFMAGRIHMYEGYSAQEATLPIRVFGRAGVKELIVTAACGALNEKFRVGDFVILSDLLTIFLAIDNPLKGTQFVDTSAIFAEELRKKAIKIAIENNISFHEGVYAYYHGPNYETPADKMALRFLGADVVGMSTVPETIMARALGIKVLAIAFVTNLAFVKHDHREVLREAERASEQMVKLLEGIINN